MLIKQLAKTQEDIIRAIVTTEEEAWVMQEFLKYEEKDNVLWGYCCGVDVSGTKNTLKKTYFSQSVLPSTSPCTGLCSRSFNNVYRDRPTTAP